MYLFAAGGGYHGGRDFGDWCADQNVHKLYTIGEMDHILNYKHPNLKLLCDSLGHAFNKSTINPLGHKRETAMPDPYEFLEYYKRCVDRIKDINAGVFELDIYGHLPVDTVDGVYRELSSIKGKIKVIRCFHPLALDKDYSLRTLKKWIDQGQDIVAISKSSSECFPEIFKLTMAEKVKVHGLALTGPSVLSKFPFYSSDSSNALVTPFVTGTVVLDSGERISLAKALEKRSLNYLLFKDYESRLVQSIKMYKEQEIFFTRLWKTRGITWE